MADLSKPEGENISGNQVATLREKLASIEHERWADWQSWVHTLYRDNREMFDTYIERWEKQIATPYAELSKQEQESDMEQVNRYWSLIEEFVAVECQKARLDELEHLPWKRADKYGINSPYVTKKWLLERKTKIRGNDLVSTDQDTTSDVSNSQSKGEEL